MWGLKLFLKLIVNLFIIHARQQCHISNNYKIKKRKKTIKITTKSYPNARLAHQQKFAWINKTGVDRKKKKKRNKNLRKPKLNHLSLEKKQKKQRYENSKS